MVGKNNKFLKENKNNQRFLRFSLRKLSVGVVSVAIAAGFYVGGSQSVLADTTSTDPVVRQNAPNDDSTVNTDKNTVNQQSASTSADSSAVAGAADSTAAEAVKSAASAAEQQKTTTLNVAEAKPAAALNTANLLYNKAQSSAVSDAASTVNDDDLLKNIKISNPTDPNFVQYQDLVDSYMSYHYGEEKPSQYVFSVISDSRIDTDFIWTVDQDTGEKVSVYFFNNWDSRITGYHQFINDDFDDNHNDYRYSKRGLFTLSYDKPEGSSGSISVVDDHHILNLGDANLQDVYEINGSTDNSRSDSFAITLPEKGQPIIKFLYRNPDTGKLMDLRAPIYYSNGLTGQKFELDIGDSYKQGLKDMFAGFKLVGSSKASGTFTQFAQGKTYVEHIASDDSEVIYQQIDAEGTMKVFYREKDGEKQPLLDKHGNPYQLEAGSSVKIDTGNDIITAYNPFVTGDHAYELIYEPEDQSANIVYVDKDGNKIKTDTVNGKTTQTVDVKSNVPAGWVLVKGQHDAPATITFTGAHTDDITIKIEHGKTSVDHNHPVTPGDKTPSGKEIKGAHDEDLNQTITRTVNITEPGQATKTTTQVAHIYRDATVDDVTGEVTYSAWSTDSADWTAVNVPSHAGYTAHQSDGQTGIPVVTVKDGQKDVNIDVTYTPDEQKGQITYVDEKGNQISSTPLTGK
ncbi:mucin-binding protein, partial [Limosilactobacillus coleohominis]|uniref:mucin-binding protein n=1 Tax=Limosilactobacillus coleohominis TaxID=181675 RepID=UPI00195C4778